MHPDEQYSGDATEDKAPWSPPVWRIGPDGVIAQAKAWLMENRTDVLEGLTGGQSIPAMSGVNQNIDEVERTIDPNDPPEGKKIGRAALWQSNLSYLRATNIQSAAGIKPIDWQPPHKQVNPEFEG